MRTLFCFLLCFFVAFHGLAVPYSPQEPCPMMASANASSFDADSSVENSDKAGAAADCCHDAKTMAMTGKVCKSDTSCSTATVCLLFTAFDYAALKPTEPVLAGSDMALSRTPSAHWRPPSIL